MNQIKKLLVENLNYIFNILKPYKHQKISTFVEIQLQDFIQLFSRLQLIQTKLQQLFKMCDTLQKSGIALAQSQKQILKEKNEIQLQMQEIEKLLFDDTQVSLQETQKQAQDISELCGEAYKNLLDNQSFDLTKISQIQPPQIDDIGEWDSKLESSRDKTSEFDQIRKAFQILDKAKLFEPSNLQMLMKCAENTDKQIYMDFFLQVINIQRKQQQSYSKQVDERSPELREQILQMPICQEFSFESPLPSLREHEQPQQQFKHVKLEDLLKIEERLISDTSPKKQNFVKKLPTKKNSIDNSFYSQHNIKHLIRRYPNNSIQREKSPSEHISRSSCSLLVEQSQSTRQQKEVFKRKISQPTSITERNANI
ncbi:unnamed protein product [Paramecium sonneborni]|uniref:Uncharacterized protein n=1 Tax=Paramecium sonneborni TaxID=65129 RepID=A0A8S1KWV9_9CILI|nr:unnamed protein product [Paramecium sonneborni]